MHTEAQDPKMGN